MLARQLTSTFGQGVRSGNEVCCPWKSLEIRLVKARRSQGNPHSRYSRQRRAPGRRDDADRQLDQSGAGGAMGRPTHRRRQARTDHETTAGNVERRCEIGNRPTGCGALSRLTLSLCSNGVNCPRKFGNSRLTSPAVLHKVSGQVDKSVAYLHKFPGVTRTPRRLAGEIRVLDAQP